MKSITDNISNKSEDSSDDFFQSKHINKRKKIFEREIKNRRKKNRVMNKNAFLMLEKGLERVITAHANKICENEREELFLELFSKLRIDKRFFGDYYGCEHRLLNESDDTVCVFDIQSNYFWINDYPIRDKFISSFNTKHDEISCFMKDMLKKYFNIRDTTFVITYFTKFTVD